MTDSTQSPNELLREARASLDKTRCVIKFHVKDPGASCFMADETFSVLDAYKEAVGAIGAIDAYLASQNEAKPAADRIEALERENARLRAVMERCATIVDRNLYRQSEKVEDVPILLRQALTDTGEQP